MTYVRRAFNMLLIVAVGLLLWLVVAHPDWIVAGPPNADALSLDKGDVICTGTESVGRCADKCPPGSYEIGREQNGAVICKNEPTGCPYGDSIPLDSPKCTAPNPVVYNADNPTDVSDPVASFGK